MNKISNLFLVMNVILCTFTQLMATDTTLKVAAIFRVLESIELLLLIAVICCYYLLFVIVICYLLLICCLFSETKTETSRGTRAQRTPALPICRRCWSRTMPCTSSTNNTITITTPQITTTITGSHPQPPTAWPFPPPPMMGVPPFLLFVLKRKEKKWGGRQSATIGGGGVRSPTLSCTPARTFPLQAIPTPSNSHSKQFPLQAIPTPSNSHSKQFPLQAIPTPSNSHSKQFPLQAIPTPSNSHSKQFPLQATPTPSNSHSKQHGRALVMVWLPKHLMPSLVKLLL